MENTVSDVSLPSIILESAEGLMLKEDEVREVLSRIERGEKIKTIARELGVDRKTIKRCGGWVDGEPRSASGGVRSIHSVSSSNGAGRRWTGTR